MEIKNKPKKTETKQSTKIYEIRNILRIATQQQQPTKKREADDHWAIPSSFIPTAENGDSDSDSDGNFNTNNK